jgi:hypothetical protein
MASWGEQFKSGDQGNLKKQFWRKNNRECPLCQGTDIKSETQVAGCRHNGDGYGTEVFLCMKCNWTTSFQYDEADGPYYYETRDWYMTDEQELAHYAKREAAKTASKVPAKPGPGERLTQWGTVTKVAIEPTPETYKPITPHVMDEAMLAKYNRISKLLPEDQCRYNMRLEGLAAADINRFFKLDGKAYFTIEEVESAAAALDGSQCKCSLT